MVRMIWRSLKFSRLVIAYLVLLYIASDWVYTRVHGNLCSD